MNPGGGINRGESGTAATSAAYASGDGRPHIEERGTSMTVLCDQQIQELIEKKCRYNSISSVMDKEEIYKIKQKLLRHLTSKGHDFDLCHQLTQEYISSAQHNDPS